MPDLVPNVIEGQSVESPPPIDEALEEAAAGGDDGSES